MGLIVVCGGGIVGLSAALLLARDGHEVTVLEADPAVPPTKAEQAWTSWERPGVAQFRQPHNLLPPFLQTLNDELPELPERLRAAGCGRGNLLEPHPPSIPDWVPRADDTRFDVITGRRAIVEAVVAAVADEEEGVTVRRGERIAGLLTGDEVLPSVPHIRGVRTHSGQEFPADLVLDAMGRRTPAAEWLGDIGAVAPLTESADSGFLYYSRYFTGPRLPSPRAAPFTAMGTFSVLTVPGDNTTWSVTVVASSADHPMRALREADCFTRLLRACPAHAHWLDGAPLSNVLAMAGVLDRHQRFVVEGRPIATGFVAVGDAWACTNPSAGRGLTMGLLHALLLRDNARQHLDDPAALAIAFDDATEQALTPLYREQITEDRARLAEMDALRRGLEPETEADQPDTTMRRLDAGAMRDQELFRAAVEVRACLTRLPEVLARPGVLDRINALGAQAGAGGPVPGPDRSQLLDLLDPFRASPGSAR